MNNPPERKPYIHLPGIDGIGTLCGKAGKSANVAPMGKEHTVTCPDCKRAKWRTQQ